jgi:GntR family transcriptional repressor for pyruvate dehydrogenase complex
VYEDDPPPVADEAPAPLTVEFRSLARGARLSDRVAKLMRDAIVSQNLEPGTQLPTERELGEQFGVSRTVIREAIRFLDATGIVEVRSGSGLRVAAVDSLTVTQSLSWFIRGGKLEYAKVHEVRKLIEVEMAGLSAERRTDEQLAGLELAHERFTRLLEADVEPGAEADVEAAAWADVAFHNAIAGATGNELYTAILESIADALIDVRRQLLAAGLGPETVDHHRAILDCIEARDVAGARKAMHEHLKSVRRRREPDTA